MGFIFDAHTDVSSPEEVEKRRALIRALMMRSASKVPDNPWQGLSSISEAIGQRLEQNRLDEAEKQGRAGADTAFAPVNEALTNEGTPDMSALASILSNPWSNDDQRSLARTYLELHAFPPRVPPRKP
jgi:hypothetical protein